LACASFAGLSGILFSAAIAAGVGREAPDVTTSHGYATFGSLKYGPDFQHFDYVNPAAPKGGTYRYAQTGSFDSLNTVTLLGTSPPPQIPLHDTLLQQSRDEAASFYCLICRTVSWPKDRAWIEFELDEAARWHDGVPITADDVLYTYEVAQGLTMALYSRVPQITERVEKLGPRTIRFHFKMKDNPTFPVVVGMMPILPRHFHGDADLDQPSLDVPLGSGPYRIAKVSPGRNLVMERVKDYWAAKKPVNVGRWNFDTLRLDYYRDMSLQNEAFFAGLNDFRLEINAANIRQQDRVPAFRSGEIKREVLSYDNGTAYNAITINVRRPLLADRTIRKAMILAYDYEWTRQVILGGDFGRVESYFPNSDFVASGLPDESELAILDKYRGSLPPEVFTREPWLPVGGDRAKARANLLEARALLHDSGYRMRDGKLLDPVTDKPIEFELLTYSPLLYANVAQFIRNMERLGIRINYRSVDAAQLTLLMGSYDYDLLIQRSPYVPTASPGVGLAMQWGSQTVNTPNQLNYSGVQEPVLDQALKQLIEATDRETVVSSIKVIDRVARWNFYSIPINHSYPAPVGQMPVAYWDKFGRPAKEPTYNYPFLTMEHWWYDPVKASRLTYGAR